MSDHDLRDVAPAEPCFECLGRGYVQVFAEWPPPVVVVMGDTIIVSCPRCEGDRVEVPA